MFSEAISTVEEVNIPDIRAHASYALLLFSTAKVKYVLYVNPCRKIEFRSEPLGPVAYKRLEHLLTAHLAVVCYIVVLVGLSSH